MKLNKNNLGGADKVELQIAPLIDVVFLLLIYFMVTASLIKKEADISFVLPATAKVAMTDIPLEIMIEIAPNGAVYADGMTFAAEDVFLAELASHLRSAKAVAQSQRSPFSVNLVPDGETLQERVLNVMDACAAAGVKSLSFSKSM